MKPSTCVVSAKDYARFWDGKGELLPKPWTGVERRVQPDRRTTAHDRRWDAAAGRRRYAGTHDRRVKQVPA